MSKTISTTVWRAFERGKLRQIASSEDQLRRLCPECTKRGWSIDSLEMSVGEAKAVVIDWAAGRDTPSYHVHWQCPLCGGEHISDFHPHADSNPVLWFCEGGSPDNICLVRWEFEDGLQRVGEEGG